MIQDFCVGDKNRVNNIVYKSFAYQFDPLVHVRLTNDKYDNIDMLMTDAKPYWMHFEKPSKHLQQQLIKKLAIPKAVRTMLFAEELRSSKREDEFVYGS